MAIVRVTVPATASNLGPALDSIALALTLHNVIELRDDRAAGVRIQGEESLPRDARNPALQGAMRVFREAGCAPGGFSLRLETNIPPACGLGDRTALVVGGLVGANVMLGSPFQRDELLRMATAIEGRANTAAAALFGGLMLSTNADGTPITQNGRIAPMQVGVVLPPLATTLTRTAPPDLVTLDTAVTSIGRSVLLTHALAAGDFRLLREAMRDDLHEPARRAAIPAAEALFEAAYRYGAAGAAVSGNGPAVVVFAEEALDAVIDGMRRSYRMAAGTDLQWWVLSIDTQGIGISEMGTFNTHDN